MSEVTLNVQPVLITAGCNGEIEISITNGPPGPSGPGGTVESVTGLNTDNTDPDNPIVRISVDGLTITGEGTPSSPLVALGGGGGIPQSNFNIIA